MSPLVLIVFAPVVLGGAALFGLLAGAATAGVWEAAEGRSQGRPPTTAPEPAGVASPGRPRNRAA